MTSEEEKLSTAKNDALRDRRAFLSKAARLGGVAGAGILGAGDLLKTSNEAFAANQATAGYKWKTDSYGNLGMFDSNGTEILSITDQGLLTLFAPSSSNGPGSDLRVNYSNSLFGSGIPRIGFAMKWGKVTSSESVTVQAPQVWDVVYLMVGHLKITGYEGINPVTFTVNYTDPTGYNFTGTLCSVTPTTKVQNVDFSPICEDIGYGTDITVSVNLGVGDSVENMQGYLTFIEVDRRPGGQFNINVPSGMNEGDANQQLMGFSTGDWDGQLQ